MKNFWPPLKWIFGSISICYITHFFFVINALAGVFWDVDQLQLSIGPTDIGYHIIHLLHLSLISFLFLFLYLSVDWILSVLKSFFTIKLCSPLLQWSNSTISMWRHRLDMWFQILLCWSSGAVFLSWEWRRVVLRPPLIGVEAAGLMVCVFCLKMTVRWPFLSSVPPVLSFFV